MILRLCGTSMHFPLARLFSTWLCCADIQQGICTAMLYWFWPSKLWILEPVAACQLRTGMHPPWMYWALFRLPHDLKLLASNSRTHSTTCSAVIVVDLDPLDITYIASPHFPSTSSLSTHPSILIQPNWNWILT